MVSHTVHWQQLGRFEPAVAGTLARYSSDHLDLELDLDEPSWAQNIIGASPSSPWIAICCHYQRRPGRYCWGLVVPCCIVVEYWEWSLTIDRIAARELVEV